MDWKKRINLTNFFSNMFEEVIAFFNSPKKGGHSSLNWINYAKILKYKFSDAFAVAVAVIMEILHT